MTDKIDRKLPDRSQGEPELSENAVRYLESLPVEALQSHRDIAAKLLKDMPVVEMARSAVTDCRTPDPITHDEYVKKHGLIDPLKLADLLQLQGTQEQRTAFLQSRLNAALWTQTGRISNPATAVNKKNQTSYRLLSEHVINATNARGGEVGMLYEQDGQLFYREKQEFNEKFETTHPDPTKE